MVFINIMWKKSKLQYQKIINETYTVLKLIYDSASLEPFILFSFDDEKDLSGSYPNSFNAGPPYECIDSDSTGSDDS